MAPLSWNIALHKGEKNIPPDSVVFGKTEQGDTATIVPIRIEREKSEDAAKVGAKPKQEPRQEFIVPYWSVRPTGEADEANLIEGHVTVEVEGKNHQVPVLKHSKKLEPQDRLLKYVPPNKDVVGSSSSTAKRAAKAAATQKGGSRPKGR